MAWCHILDLSYNKHNFFKCFIIIISYDFFVTLCHVFCLFSIDYSFLFILHFDICAFPYLPFFLPLIIIMLYVILFFTFH